jgi:nucleotide-binding universal stress UspA family protein
MDQPPVPASVTSMITSGKLPPEFTAFFTPGGELTDETCWSHVASAVEAYLATAGVDENVRGALALAGAYGWLDSLDDGADPDQMDEDSDRAIALLREAEAHGMDEDETYELWRYAEHIGSLAAEHRDYLAEMDAYVAKHGATPRRRLDAKLGQAHELYSAGDRAAAVALFREVAEIDPWGGEFNGCFDLIDIGWCRLLHDAAQVEGPEAARKIWQEARAHHRAARFPVTMNAWPLIEMLLGKGVPDIIEVIIHEWLDAAKENGRWEEPVTEDEHRVFELAVAELDGSPRR